MSTTKNEVEINKKVVSKSMLKKKNINLIKKDDKSKNKKETIEPSKITTLNIPWIEKYRPKNVDDIVVDSGTHNKIKKIIEDKEMPNIIITGLPGIGKTTTILCIAKNLLGKYFHQGVLELNASDDRGIKAVQDSVINFCKKKLELDDTEDFVFAKHKIILLDEADNMTKKAQQLVSGLMQEYHKSTRFAFTCNNSSDIIEAIQSRCIIFRYRRLSSEQLSNRLIKICEYENVKYNKEGIDSIVMTAEGDMRKAINNLQLTHNGYKFVSPKNVYKLCDKPNPILIKNILLACYNKNIAEALKKLEKLRTNGYSSSDISLGMIKTLESTRLDEIDEKKKIEYFTEISKTSLEISKGIDSFLQLNGCVAHMCLN